jgi:chaperone BCS1
MTYEGMHSAQFMGLINAVRTGDPFLDMVAAFLLPFIVQQIISQIPTKIKQLLRYLFGEKNSDAQYFTRNIVYRSTQNASNGVRMSTDEDSFNMYLLRAVQLYVNHHCQLSKLIDAHLDLTLLDTSNCTNRNGRVTVNNNNNNATNASTVDMLTMCSFVEKPLENKWLNVGKYDGGTVEIMVCDSASSGGNGKQKKNTGGDNESGGDERNGGGKSESTRSLEIKLRSTESVECLHAFLKSAFDWYVDEIRKMDNKDRFMLDVQLTSPRSSSTPQYVAYKLGEEKTFDTLFNRKCHDLLRIVEHFENKTGKYAIKGYPHKLGLLLAGLPGTGKTSLIKALAHLTERHIVNVNLSRIATNSELRKVFFNKMYQILGGNTTNFMRLDFSQVIFVLEDVDAGAKEVVMDRDMLAKIDEERAAQEKAEEKKGEKQGVSAFPGAPRVLRPPAMIPGDDRLNLSGLLNVLDGVVETPGRMVIMTTNHPDILDPALIRPGRIDKILKLGYMEEPDDIVAMVNHYYPEQSLSDLEKKRVIKYILHDQVKITPAQVEQLAMEEDTLPGFLERLGNYGKDNERSTRLSKFVIGSADGSSPTSTSSGSDVGNPATQLDMLLSGYVEEGSNSEGDY